jgi:hypothetical protein
MKMIFQSFGRIVTTEIVKLRGTFAFWLTLIYPLGTVLLVTLFWISMRNNKEIGTDIFISNMGNVASFFLPFFIVLMISVACNTEHKSSMLKHVLALPVPRTHFYLGKFTGIMVFIALALILTVLLTYTSLFICGLIVPKLGFGTSFNHMLLFQRLIKAYIAAASVYSIQYWLGMRLRNLTMPVAIGSALIILPIATLIIMGIAGLIQRIEDFTKIISYNPYSYPYASAFNLMKSAGGSIFPALAVVFIFLSVIVLALGAWEFNRRNIV